VSLFQVLISKNVEVESSAQHFLFRRVIPGDLFQLLKYPSVVKGALGAFYLPCVYLKIFTWQAYYKYRVRICTFLKNFCVYCYMDLAD
ncbi:hypothetical protein N311_11412, partial [Apaloderma vittatum]